VRLLVDKVFYNENPDTITRFREKWIHIEYLQWQKLHAKAILADKKYLYIGSINFSTYSFDKNREVGIITSQTSIITDFLKVFDEDFILY
jgi:phosphatidylserine/phosphatidylglycerophosphate/cardiolipin synthase-like enzyme